MGKNFVIPTIYEVLNFFLDLRRAVQMKARKECEILPAMTLIKIMHRHLRKRLWIKPNLFVLHRRQIDMPSRDAWNNCKCIFRVLSFFLVFDDKVVFCANFELNDQYLRLQRFFFVAKVSFVWYKKCEAARNWNFRDGGYEEVELRMEHVLNCAYLLLTFLYLASDSAFFSACRHWRTSN